MGEMYFMISDAAKKVEVENHVLRYWEEELHLPIQRNELGHRHYSKEDIERFQRIKQLKEQGIQLKAIRNMLDKMDRSGKTERTETAETGIHIFAEETRVTKSEIQPEEKAARLQYLLKQMIGEAMSESGKIIAEEVKGSILKEMDYQFRLQEEREETREENRCKREEEHYRKVDELLRTKTQTRKEKKKKHSFF